MLSNQWTVKDFYPIEYLPRGVRLSAYGGDASDLPVAVLQDSSTPSPRSEPAFPSIAPTRSIRSSKPTPTWNPVEPPGSSS